MAFISKQNVTWDKLKGKGWHLLWNGGSKI